MAGGPRFWRAPSRAMRARASVCWCIAGWETTCAKINAAVLKEKDEPRDEELAALLEEANAAGVFDERPVITKQMTSTALNAYPLKLSSTLVGTRARTAIINGKAFSQGTVKATAGFYIKVDSHPAAFA